ncbi:hypothetical protein X798_02062 [Onchocerca flexuosa]|uniref:NADP-dependent oxidoreductase domain-containing protein n=1 Tax=Onchocerca flexuosa TaxID=387005 RepID=A0A238C1Y0_9BILA|nr:hypothetical protein X798_02062 [Onchocerca flexuosa]
MPAQTCLRYLIERDIAVIPKSVKEHGVKENFEFSQGNFTRLRKESNNQKLHIFDFELTESEVKGCKNVKHCQHPFLFDYQVQPNK